MIEVTESSTSSNQGQGHINRPGEIVNAQIVKDERITTSSVSRGLPVLVARFQTAEYLIALEVLKKEEVVISDTPVSYSEELNEDLYERKASLKVHTRILERSGRIIKAVDIVGEHSEHVVKPGPN